MNKPITIPNLEDSFDNEAAERLLNMSIDKISYPSEIVRKSMYDFDLETPEGIEKLVALLPIMDPEILVDIMGEIWPGYPTDVDARRHRLEIKGYLKDYLESLNAQETSMDEGASSELAVGRSDVDSTPENAGEGVKAEVAS